MERIDIINLLSDKFASSLSSIPPESLIIRGIWNTKYAIDLPLSTSSRPLNLEYILLQTTDQGCCYIDPSVAFTGIDDSLIGKSIIDIDADHSAVRIASLDAVFSQLAGKPTQIFNITGKTFEKSIARAQIIVDEAKHILRRKKPKNGKKFKIVNVGVVSDILRVLSEEGFADIVASDFYETIVGDNIFGANVRHGNQTIDLIEKSDLAIITGMTLANGSLDLIIPAANKSNTSLVMFAETGANFSSTYVKLGVDSVVSESFPFYLSANGNSSLKIFRR